MMIIARKTYQLASQMVKPVFSRPGYNQAAIRFKFLCELLGQVANIINVLQDLNRDDVIQNAVIYVIWPVACVKKNEVFVSMRFKYFLRWPGYQINPLI